MSEFSLVAAASASVAGHPARARSPVRAVGWPGARTSGSQRVGADGMGNDSRKRRRWEGNIAEMRETCERGVCGGRRGYRRARARRLEEKSRRPGPRAWAADPSREKRAFSRRPARRASSTRARPPLPLASVPLAHQHWLSSSSTPFTTSAPAAQSTNAVRNPARLGRPHGWHHGLCLHCPDDLAREPARVRPPRTALAPSHID
jgi:hypothetical protein